MDPDVKSDAWFPCYPDDLLGATSHMSNHDFGAYWKMLCWYYKNGPLPNDDDSLRRIGTVERQDWMRTKGIVMAKFVLNGDGKFHQGRADEIISERNEINRKVAEKSRKGVEARRALGQLPPEPQVEPVVEPVVEPQENQGFNLGRTQPQPQPQPHVQTQPHKANERLASQKIRQQTGIELDALIHDTQSPDRLIALCVKLLGKDEMAHCGSRWRQRASEHPDKLRRVLDDIRVNQREGKHVKNPGAYAEDLWKRFQ